jgi:hypothetical protein
MALDGAIESDIDVITKQEVDEAVNEIGSFVSLAAEAQVAKTVITLILTREDGVAKPIIEVMFAGDPEDFGPMMALGDKLLKQAARTSEAQIEYAERIAQTGDALPF